MARLEHAGDVFEAVAFSKSEPPAPGGPGESEGDEGQVEAEPHRGGEVQNDVERQNRGDESDQPRPGAEEERGAAFLLEKAIGGGESPSEGTKRIGVRLALGREDGGAHGE